MMAQTGRNSKGSGSESYKSKLLCGHWHQRSSLPRAWRVRLHPLPRSTSHNLISVSAYLRRMFPIWAWRKKATWFDCTVDCNFASQVVPQPRSEAASGKSAMRSEGMSLTGISFPRCFQLPLWSPVTQKMDNGNGKSLIIDAIWQASLWNGRRVKAGELIRHMADLFINSL